MPYFFVPQEIELGGEFWLEGEEAQHLLKSRRVRGGETVAVQAPSGARFLAALVQAERSRARMRALSVLAPPPLPERRLILVLAAVKEKAADLALQKAVELGVAELRVFMARNSPVSPRELEAPRTRARWERILREACKQCERQFPPGLEIFPSLEATLAGLKDAELRVVLDPAAQRPLASIARDSSSGAAVALVGPEGGLTPEEIQQAAAAGFQPASLGKLVLRSETAVIAACALLLFASAPRG